MEDLTFPKSTFEDYYMTSELADYIDALSEHRANPSLPEPVAPRIDPVALAYALSRFHEINHNFTLRQLRWARGWRGLSQANLATLMGVSQQAISKSEAHDWDPRLSTVRAFANAVGLQIRHEITYLGDFNPFWKMIEEDRYGPA